MQMETVTTGTAVRYFVMAATPSRLYIFQGTTSLEVNFCLPLGILCACSLLCLTPCLLSPSWARDFTAQGPWSSIFDNMFPLLSLRSGNVGWMYVWQAVFMSYAEGIAHFTELPGEIPNRWSKWEYFFCHHSCQFSHSSAVSNLQKLDRQMQMLSYSRDWWMHAKV